jgi:hypothetical protein
MKLNFNEITTLFLVLFITLFLANCGNGNAETKSEETTNASKSITEATNKMEEQVLGFSIDTLEIDSLDFDDYDDGKEEEDTES